MLVLFVLALGVLCGFVAMSVDVGLILHERRQLQNTADAAALAGAQELFNSPAAAVAMAQLYAENNGINLSGSADTFEATTPYQFDSGKIEVTVSRQVGFLFGRVLGLDVAEVTARAVGEQALISSQSYEYALFATEDDCSAQDPFRAAGSDIDVIGATHSNSKIKVSGSNSSFTGGITHTCSFENSGQNNSYNPLPAQAPVLQIGWSYTFSSFPCDYTYTQNTALASRPEAWVGGNPSSKQLNPGVYCSTQDIQLSGQDVSGNVTLVAMDEVKISGSDFNLSAYYEGVLAYSQAGHGQAIDISGSDGVWDGFIYAPNGTVKFAGNNDFSLLGSVVANTIHVSGQDFSLNASGYQVPSYGPGLVKLVE